MNCRVLENIRHAWRIRKCSYVALVLRNKHAFMSSDVFGVGCSANINWSPSLLVLCIGAKHTFYNVDLQLKSLRLVSGVNWARKLFSRVSFKRFVYRIQAKDILFMFKEFVWIVLISYHLCKFCSRCSRLLWASSWCFFTQMASWSRF
jgi:hypothetical protein